MVEQIPPALAATAFLTLLGRAVLLYRPLTWWAVYLGFKEATQ